MPRIVGVVGHVNQWGLDDTARPLHSQIYIAADQMPDHDVNSLVKGMEVYVRGNGTKLPSSRYCASGFKN